MNRVSARHSTNSIWLLESEQGCHWRELFKTEVQGPVHKDSHSKGLGQPQMCNYECFNYIADSDVHSWWRATD